MHLVAFGVGYVGLVTERGSPRSGTTFFASTSNPSGFAALKPGSPDL